MRSVAEQDETDAAQDAAVTKDVATGDDSPDGPGTSTDLGLTECPCDDEEEHHTKTKGLEAHILSWASNIYGSFKCGTSFDPKEVVCHVSNKSVKEFGGKS